MVDQRVVDYIKQQLTNGFTREQIKQGLLSKGWQESQIEEAMPPSISQESNKSGKIKDKGPVPGLVKFFAVLSYIGSVSEVIAGIMLIAGGSFLSSLPMLSDSFSFLAIFSNSMIVFVTLGIISFGLAVLNFFMGRGLWKGQNWARMLLVISAILGAIYSIYLAIASPASGITSLALSAAIACYLLFSKKVKQAFA